VPLLILSHQAQAHTVPPEHATRANPASPCNTAVRQTSKPIAAPLNAVSAIRAAAAVPSGSVSDDSAKSARIAGLSTRGPLARVSAVGWRVSDRSCMNGAMSKRYGRGVRKASKQGALKKRSRQTDPVDGPGYPRNSLLPLRVSENRVAAVSASCSCSSNISSVRNAWYFFAGAAREPYDPRLPTLRVTVAAPLRSLHQRS
jgi:hypothetical protein